MKLEDFYEIKLKVKDNDSGKIKPEHIVVNAVGYVDALSIIAEEYKEIEHLIMSISLSKITDVKYFEITDVKYFEEEIWYSIQVKVDDGETKDKGTIYNHLFCCKDITQAKSEVEKLYKESIADWNIILLKKTKIKTVLNCVFE